MEIQCVEFPSPGGDYGLSDSTSASWSPSPGSVSVPWRGLRSFGRGLGGRPSQHCGLSFRPLAGIRVFRTRRTPSGADAVRFVSVPWRGLGSFGLLELSSLEMKVEDVSVPWRGLGSFGLSGRLAQQDWAEPFPSPGGD